MAANVGPQFQGAGSSGAGGGAGSTAANFSNAQTTYTTTDNSNVSAAAQTSFAPVISGGEGSTLTYNGSDFGAIGAAQTVWGEAVSFAGQVANDATSTEQMALKQAQQTVAAQGSGALSMITTPFLIAAGIVAVVIVAVVFFKRKKKGDEK